MNLKIFQKYYIKCSIETNKINNCTEDVLNFKNKFPDNNFIFKEDIVKKMITEVKGSTKIYQ